MFIFNKKIKKNRINFEDDVTNKRNGWDDITNTFLKLYPEQTEPKHYGTLTKWRFGGNDPLDGVSVYDAGAYYHFVTYGLSELYEKESENRDISGFGMEFTFKLKKDSISDLEAEFKNVCAILSSIAKITFVNNELILPMQYVYNGQTVGFDATHKSELTGFITISDPKIPKIDTINGNLQFVELIGATDKELKAIIDEKLTIEEFYQKLGTDVTDYERKSII